MVFGKLFGKKKKKNAETPVTDSTPDDWNRADQKATVVADGPASVCFENHDTTQACESGTTILDVAIAAGVDLNHYCGGMASCGSCMVTVVSGQVSELDDMEEATLDVVLEDDRDRLGCQCRVLGPVTIIVPPQD